MEQAPRNPAKQIKRIKNGKRTRLLHVEKRNGTVCTHTLVGPRGKDTETGRRGGLQGAAVGARVGETLPVTVHCVSFALNNLHLCYLFKK